MIDSRVRCLTGRTKSPLIASQDIVPSECGFHTSADVPSSSLPFASTRKLDILRGLMIYVETRMSRPIYTWYCWVKSSDSKAVI